MSYKDSKNYQKTRYFRLKTLTHCFLGSYVVMHKIPIFLISENDNYPASNFFATTYTRVAKTRH
jgi:hypothetical protein